MLRKAEATVKGGHAYQRLLQLAKTRDSEMRAVDEAISDDMLLCIDALRWGQSDLYRLVPEGDRRVRAAIEKWGLKWPESL